MKPEHEAYIDYCVHRLGECIERLLTALTAYGHVLTDRERAEYEWARDFLEAMIPAGEGN